MCQRRQNSAISLEKIKLIENSLIEIDSDNLDVPKTISEYPEKS